MSFSITLNLPPSTNTVYRRSKNGRMFMTDAGSMFKTMCFLRIKSIANAHAGGYTKKDRLAFTLRLWFPDANRCDIDNRVKLVQDAAALALGFDDMQIDRLVVERMEIDPKDPRCEITIERITK